MKKSILFTTHHLVNYAGSEINILELALEFRKLGWTVEVATFIVGQPIVDDFKKHKIKVYDVLNEKIKKKNYDLIWAQHTPVLEYVLFNVGVRAKKIVHSSLSFFEPLETPPEFANELTFSLVNSEENMEVVRSYGIKNVYLLRNFIPSEYIDNKVGRRTRKLSKIAIVSNHVPKEILELSELLKKDGLQVDIYGHGYKFERITSELLRKYDLIISIGKTVQYALGLGIPVFVYDHFGGPGWLTEKNFFKSEYHNFSGRSHPKKYSVSKLKDLITKGFVDARKEQAKLSKEARNRYSLSKNLDKFLKEIDSHEDIQYSSLKKYKYLRRKNDYYVRELTTKHWYQEKYHHLTGRYNLLQREMEILDNKSEKLRSELLECKRRLDKFQSTLAYKTYVRFKRILNRLK